MAIRWVTAIANAGPLGHADRDQPGGQGGLADADVAGHRDERREQGGRADHEHRTGRS